MPAAAARLPDDAPPLDAPPLDAPPRLTRRSLALVVAAWAVYSVGFAGLLLQYPAIPSFGVALVSAAVGNALLVGWMLPAWGVVFRGMHAAAWGRRLAAHAALGPLVTAAWLASYVGFLALVSGASFRTAFASLPEPAWMAYGTLMTYVLVFAVLHGRQALQRLRLRERQAAELVALARDRELAALKAQIQPHFLFNTLNAISATVKRDPDAAREMIAELAGLLRYALDASTDAGAAGHVPLRDELAFTTAYLRLEQHRFSDRLATDVVVEAPDAALDRRVPPLVLQPLVENALRHGIAPSPEGGRVEVRVTAQGTGDGLAPASAALTVRVADTGVGPGVPLPPDGAPPDALAPEAEGDDDAGRASGGGLGLAATHARLVRTFGPTAALRLAPNTPRGLVATFQLPSEG
jgi:hypothetical protein